MKLGKVIKFLDGISNTVLYIGDEEVWSGSTVSVQAAANVNGDKQQYLEECKADEAFDAIREVATVEKYLKYKLKNHENGEAIGVTYDGRIATFHICLKKP